MIYGTDEFDLKLKDIVQGARHSCYKECVDHAEQMAWHFYGTKPLELLNRSRPREEEDVKQYRLDNYEPTTKAAADKAIRITCKIFNPNLYSIRWAEENESIEKLRDYTLYNYPKHNSLVNYMKDVLLRKMIADPNAVVVARPSKMLQSQTEQPKPILVIYGSKNVFYFDDDHYLISTNEVEGSEERDILGNKIAKKVYYFEYYDKTQFIEFKAFINSENNLEVVPISEYVYNFSEIPVWHLTGMTEAMDNGEIVYKSYYSSAAPHWNLHIIHESDLFGAYITHLHPQKWELTDTCSFRYPYNEAEYPCRNGKVKYGENRVMDCPQCGGTGRTSVKSPYGVYKINKEKLDEGSTGSLKPVEYINIPTDATKMLEVRTDEMIRNGMWAINMDIEDEVGANQSGVAKAIDRSAQYDTLYDIGSVIFDTHLQNAYYFFNAYMFKEEANSKGNPDIETNLPEINKPTQFNIESATELVANFKNAKDSGIDPTYLNLKTKEILSRDLTTNPDLKAFTILLMDLDPLAGMDQLTIDKNVMRGFTTKVDAVIHFNIKPFVERAIREDKNFAQLPKEKQIEVLNGYAEELIKSTEPSLDTSMLDNNGNQN